MHPFLFYGLNTQPKLRYIPLLLGGLSVSESIEDIVNNARNIQSGVPFRTDFERENFLFNTVEGPRLLLVLCQDIEQLNQVYENCRFDWEKKQVADEMAIIGEKIKELQEQYGPDIARAVEDDEPNYWAETLARRAAVETLTQKMTHDNMADMLNLPLAVYEAAVTKCQTYLNVVSKTTRAAERKANMAARPDVDVDEE